MFPIAIHNAKLYCGEEVSRLILTQLKQGALLTGNLTGATYIFEKYSLTEDSFTIWGYAIKWGKWVRQSYTGYDCEMFSVSKYMDINKLKLKLMVEEL